MELPSSSVPLLLLLCLCLSSFPPPHDAASAASAYHPNVPSRAPTDVDQLTRTLLSHRDDPFAADDAWASVPRVLRGKWADAHLLFPVTKLPPDSSAPLPELLRTVRGLRDTPIPVHIDVQIVAPQHLLSPHRRRRILHYATAMRAGANGTSLQFTVSIAPPQVFQRVAMHPKSTHPATFTALLDARAATTGALNVLYVILNSESAPVTDYVAPIPFLGATRAALFVYTPPDPSRLAVPAMLTATERAAQRVFAPIPLYSPLPFVTQLQIHVVAYTPGHDAGIRAPWLQNFSSEHFEASVRAHVLPHHTVRFMSWQTNAECTACRTVFRDVDKQPSDDFVRNAVRALNGNIMPDHTWATPPGPSAASGTGRAAGSGARSAMGRGHDAGLGRAVGGAAADTLRIFILDTSKVRRSDALARLERRCLFAFPGIAIIVVRASETAAARMLHTVMLRAVVASVYGVADPALYIPVARRADGVAVSDPGGSGDDVSAAAAAKLLRPSPVLWDMSTRNVVRSMVERRLDELEEIVDGMIYFEVDPAKALDEWQYVAFAERVNLLLFKLQTAQRVLGDMDGGVLAMYLVAATAHDMRAVRAAFDIDDEQRVLRRFRDPTVRCHFSRFKREALRASEILETRYPSMMPVAIALTSFGLAIAVTRAILLWLATRKSPGKQE